MERIIILVVLLMSSLAGSAENIEDTKAKVSIVGHVCDSNTGEPLEGTKVYVEDLGLTIYTDEMGNFSFEGFADKKYGYSLEMISYEQLNINSESDCGMLIFKMQEVD